MSTSPRRSSSPTVVECVGAGDTAIIAVEKGCRLLTPGAPGFEPPPRSHTVSRRGGTVKVIVPDGTIVRCGSQVYIVSGCSVYPLKVARVKIPGCNVWAEVAYGEAGGKTVRVIIDPTVRYRCNV